MKRLVTSVCPARDVVLLLATALLAGCGRENITVYRVPKEAEPQMSEAQGEAGPQPRLLWKTPPGWKEQAPGGMSLLSFLVPGEAGRAAQLSVMTFPGEGAGELSLINIVRENVGLPPLSEEELSRLVETVEIGGETAKLTELTGAGTSSGNPSPNRILVAVLPRAGLTWFFKFAGDPAVVSAQKPAFLDFLKAVSFAEVAAGGARPPRFVSTNVKRLPGNAAEGETARPSWEVPPGWQEVPPGQMLLAKFLAGDEQGRAEITVTAFPGSTGGVLANVNRWRNQLGLAPLDQAQAEQQVTQLDVMGGKAMLVDVNGLNSKTGQPARLIGVIAPREGQTWFYKLLGDPATAEREKDAFIKFVQSVRYPDA